MTESEKENYKSPVPRNALIAIIMLLTVIMPPAHSENVTYREQRIDYPHPLFSSSFGQAQDNITTYRFRIYNPLNSSTTSFRLWLESGFSWFDPNVLDYPLHPDGIDGNISPYWDLPPLEPDESTEVAFSVKRLVALPESIGVKAVPTDLWGGGCKHLVPFNSSDKTLLLVEGFLNMTNRTQEVTGYYEAGKNDTDTTNTSLLLAYLHGYGTFAVFDVTNGSVRAVSDNATISGVINAYAKAVTPSSDANLSMLYAALLDSRGLKADPEHECYMLTGMDKYPCIDRNSCLYACFSVTVCSYVGSSGWSFLDTVQDYNQSVSKANAILSTAIDSSKRLSKDYTYAAAVKAYGDLKELNRAESKVVFHPLFMSYGFCEPPDYGIPGQTGARRELLDYLADNCAYGETDRIMAESAHATRFLGPLPQKTLRNTMEPDLSNASISNISSTSNTSIPAADKTLMPANTSIRKDMSCCFGSACSIAGMERIGGLCWEWSALAVAVLGLGVLGYGLWVSGSGKRHLR